MIARVLRGIADAIDPPRSHDRSGSRPVSVAGPTIFEREEARQQERQAVALSLLDDEVLGYVVMVVRRTTYDTAHVDLEIVADDPFWPALSETAARLVLEGDRAFGEQS